MYSVKVFEICWLLSLYFFIDNLVSINMNYCWSALWDVLAFINIIHFYWEFGPYQYKLLLRTTLCNVIYIPRQRTQNIKYRFSTTFFNYFLLTTMFLIVYFQFTRHKHVLNFQCFKVSLAQVYSLILRPFGLLYI